MWLFRLLVVLWILRSPSFVEARIRMIPTTQSNDNPVTRPEQERKAMVVTTRTFDECVEQRMTAFECQNYIQSILGQDLSNHEIPNLQIDIVRPRSEQVLQDSYYMISIPVNVFGQVDCEVNHGIIAYPWIHTASDGTNHTIPNTDCSRTKNASDCCTTVLNHVQASGIVQPDIHGNYLSCYVHQEPLEPMMAPQGTLVYLEHVVISSSSSNNDTCIPQQVSVETVQAQDDKAQTQLEEAITQIHQILSVPTVPCSEILHLQMDWMVYARSLPLAENLISKLVSTIGCHESSRHVPHEVLVEPLSAIQEQFEQAKIQSTNQHIITIYTNHAGYVMTPPKIGGSRIVASPPTPPASPPAQQLPPPPSQCQSDSDCPQGEWCDSTILDCRAYAENEQICEQLQHQSKCDPETHVCWTKKCHDAANYSKICKLSTQPCTSDLDCYSWQSCYTDTYNGASKCMTAREFQSCCQYDYECQRGYVCLAGKCDYDITDDLPTYGDDD